MSDSEYAEWERNTERLELREKLSSWVLEANRLKVELEQVKKERDQARAEREDALAWHTVASAERDDLRQRVILYRKDIDQIVKALELDPLEVDIPDIVAAVRDLRKDKHVDWDDGEYNDG